MEEVRDYDFDVAEGKAHQCHICIAIVRKAVEIECGHTFCDQCLKGWQNEQHSRNGKLRKRFRCPSCNTLYVQHQVHRSAYLDRLIKHEMLVKCKRHNDGCPWVGSIDKFYQEHKNNCLVKCPNFGCNKLMKQAEINSHRRNDCLHEVIPCVHSIYGCDVVVKRGMMEEHQQSKWNHHFKLVQINCNELKEKNGTLSVQLTEANQKIAQLERNLQQQQQQQQQQKPQVKPRVKSKQQQQQQLRPAPASCLSVEDTRKDWTFDELAELLKNKSTRDKFNAIITSKPSLTKLRNHVNYTLLHRAAFHGATECVEVLIENGCNVTEKDDGGEMAIHRAAGNNRTQVMKILLSHDPSLVNVTTIYNETPLHRAAYGDHRKAVELLLCQPSVDVNARDSWGNTPDEMTGNDEIKTMIRSHHNYSTSIDD